MTYHVRCCQVVEQSGNTALTSCGYCDVQYPFAAVICFFECEVPNIRPDTFLKNSNVEEVTLTREATKST